MFQNLDRFTTNTAIIEDSNSYTFLDILNFSNELSKYIKSRDLIVHLTTNSFESIASYVSCIKNDIVSLLLSDDLEKSFLENILKSYKPKYILLPIKLQNMFQFKEIVKFKKYVLLQTTFKIDYKINDDLILLLSTSGTTGTPKFVRQSYTNLSSNSNSIIEYLNIKSSHRAVTTLPTHYTFMLSIINTHLMVGASIVVTNYSMIQKEFYQLLKQEEITTISGVPFTFEMLKRLRFENLDLANVEYITQAGGKLADKLVEYFIVESQKKNIKFIVMYGQTEATARISYLPWKKAKEKIGSIGIAIPHGKITLADDNELIYSGENVTLGYASDCYDLQNGDDNQGLLHTGDIAQVDEDGFFYITGRKKRFVKIFGNRINLDEIDSILQNGGFEAITLGDDKNIIIYGVDNNKNETLTFLSKKLKLSKNIFKYKAVEQILRNSAGKILYKEMENLYA